MHTCIYVHAQKIDTVDPNIARDFPRGNIPERYVGAFSTNSEILPSLLSGQCLQALVSDSNLLSGDIEKKCFRDQNQDASPDA